MGKITKNGYLLFDGAFGTYYAKLFGGEIPCEFACLERREAVLQIHQEYVSAGAMAIKTNTFAANTLSLGVDFSTIVEIISSACEIAKEATNGTNTLIFADIGPIPSGDQQDFAEYFKIIDCFIENGLENFLFETMQDLDAFKLADYVKKKVNNSFTITSFAVGQDGYTTKGVPAKAVAQAACGSLTDAFGFNCICGPSHLLKIITALPKSEKLLSVMPNSGYPTNLGGRTVYVDNTEYFAEKISAINASGAEILGGCCGTTPQHIAMAGKVLQEHQNHAPMTRLTQIQVAKVNENAFAAKLLGGEKVIAAELDPPFDADFSHIAEAAPIFREAGADAITIADSPLARPRADSVIISAKVQREFQIQTIPHLTCRDHNTIGLKSALLGGCIEGIRNILIVTGDTIPSIERSEIKGVFSANSFELTKFVENLNGDIFVGKEFFVGGALNVNSVNFEKELERACKKQENGTQFFLTQPIYSDEAVENFKRAKGVLRAKILAGIMPVAGYKNAVFLNNEVAGIHIPEAIVEELSGKSPEETVEISMKYAMSIIGKVWDFCDGFYIMTPLKKYQMVAELIKNIKKMDK
ncbi:MAG: bifunctional homocysteine S-methyltransferase/methylenetetrahydrofolate reductase [Oscillospiraceae bacterium]